MNNETVYKVTNNNDKEIVATFNELKGIAFFWIDDWNETILEDERKWEYPRNKSDVSEIIEEYMGCVIEPLKVETESVEDKYRTLTL